MRKIVALLALGVASPVFADAPPAAEGGGAVLPEAVRAMIETAIQGGDAGTIDAVFAVARKSHPVAIAEIQAIEERYRAALAVRQEEQRRLHVASLESANPFDHWTGQVELGASRSSGNTETLGLFGSASMVREGLQWRHKADARADFQRSRGTTTTQRLLAAWQPNYKVNERLYTFGLAQYEHDRFLGYSNRYTLGGGAGYGVLQGDRVKLDIEGGPALRYTDFVGDENNMKVAGRASMALNWHITPALQFAQTGALYLEQGDSSASASTTLDTKLTGALKARFSYNIQYERDAPPGVKPVDTLSRATLVYSF